MGLCLLRCAILQRRHCAASLHRRHVQGLLWLRRREGERKRHLLAGLWIAHHFAVDLLKR